MFVNVELFVVLFASASIVPINKDRILTGQLIIGGNTPSVPSTSTTPV